MDINEVTMDETVVQALCTFADILIFCLPFLSITSREMFKHPLVIVNLSVSSLISVSFSLNILKFCN